MKLTDVVLETQDHNILSNYEKALLKKLVNSGDISASLQKNPKVYDKFISLGIMDEDGMITAEGEALAANLNYEFTPKSDDDTFNADLEYDNQDLDADIDHQQLMHDRHNSTSNFDILK